MIFEAIYIRKIGLFSVAMALGLMAVIGIGWWQVDGPGADRSIGVPAPGLPAIKNMSFRMTDHEGVPVGPEQLLGRPSLVFFGFTYCPDVCPTTLANISGWLEDVGPDAKRLNVVLISVDPDRDTPEVLADYVAAFHPQIRGWTGSPEDLAKTASAFRATYKITPLDDGDYTMDHTASVFLFDAVGEFKSTIDFHESIEIAVPKIRRVLRDY